MTRVEIHESMFLLRLHSMRLVRAKCVLGVFMIRADVFIVLFCRQYQGKQFIVALP